MKTEGSWVTLSGLLVHYQVVFTWAIFIIVKKGVQNKNGHTLRNKIMI